MSDEAVKEEVTDAVEENTTSTFNKEVALAQSKQFIIDNFLYDPEKDTELFIATEPKIDEKTGIVEILCVDDVKAERGILFTIQSEYVQLTSEPVKPAESDIITPETSGKIIGLDGQPL